MSNEVDVEEARELLDEGATIVDVRTEEEYAEGHIPESVSTPMPEFTAHLGSLEGLEPILLVCEKGEASRQAGLLLNSYGGVDGEEVYNLSPGLREWNGELDGGNGD
ncbi:MAG: rhodanese-like domain-containing protein [Halobacteria archaeon]